VSPAVEDYEFLSSLMGEMRIAALEGEWDRLVELEKKCSQRVAVIKSQTSSAPLDEETRQRKADLIRKILADDAEIRDRVVPWMAQLQRTLAGAYQERRLLETYSSV
jgi:flagellar protein FliT